MSCRKSSSLLSVRREATFGRKRQLPVCSNNQDASLSPKDKC